MQGLWVALQPVNLLYCFVGVFLGTLVGVLPGIGPVTAMALLLPATVGASPESGLILLAGIYYGSMYGGSTTSILINVPGEAASVVTCLDGHQMARTGRAGPALALAAIGSFIAGTFAVVVLSIISTPLARVGVAAGACRLRWVDGPRPRHGERHIVRIVGESSPHDIDSESSWVSPASTQ